jgi:4'-phosphopantetheinyl transferase
MLMKIYCINKNRDISREMMRDLESLVDDHKLVRMKKYKQQESYENALLGDMLARFAVLKGTGIRYIKRPFLLNDYGKPGLPPDMSLQFNISHSANRIVCASGQAPLGIDVQLVGEINPSDIAERFFAPEEFRLLQEADDDARMELFYDLWTLKESYIKALGKGLSIRLDFFSILKTGSGIRYETQLQHEPCYFRQYPMDPHYKLSVCSFSDCFPAELAYVEVEHLYQALTSLL